jgi:hypothetical protein
MPQIDQACGARPRGFLRARRDSGTAQRPSCRFLIAENIDSDLLALLTVPAQHLMRSRSVPVPPPVRDPEYLFESPQYRETGAIFWPDYGRLGPDRAIWRLCAVEYRDEPEFESGQIVINKETCWKALNLTMFLNEYSDFFYRHVHGDKETFHMAFRRLKHPYAMPARGIQGLSGKVMCQHDLAGERVFQHRNLAKWQFNGENKPIRGFLYEKECIDFLADLGRKWDGRFPRQNRYHAAAVGSEAVRRLVGELTAREYTYDRVGHDRRPMTFLPDGRVGVGAAGCEMFWNLTGDDGHALLDLSSETTLTCQLARGADGVWRGRWLHHERMPIELSPSVPR